MYETIYKYKILLISFLVIFISCKKDTSPIDDNKRPTTGDAILTGHLYYDHSENDPAVNSTVYIYFFDDYRQILATAEIDSSGKYYIENLPEDTVDLVVAQPFYNHIVLSVKTSGISLKEGVNEVDKESIYTQSWIDHHGLVDDHFMVKFDTSYSQSEVNALNASNDIIAVTHYPTIWGNDYHFLEIDPDRDILSLIDIYHESELTIEAAPVFYDSIRDKFLWSEGTLTLGYKTWATHRDLEDIASELYLEIASISDKYYSMVMTKNTPIIQQKLRMYFALHPKFRYANIQQDETQTYDPPPWK